MLAVAQHDAAHVAHSGTVHQDFTCGDYSAELTGFRSAFDDPSDIRNDDIFRGHSHLLRQSSVLLQMSLFAVDRDKESRLCQCVDDFQFLTTGVP